MAKSIEELNFPKQYIKKLIFHLLKNILLLYESMDFFIAHFRKKKGPK